MSQQGGDWGDGRGSGGPYRPYGSGQPSYPPPSFPPQYPSTPPPSFPPQHPSAAPPAFADEPLDDGPPRSTLVPDFDRTRRQVGLWLTIMGCTLGLLLNIAVFLVPMLRNAQFDDYLSQLGRSAVLAYLPVLLYLLVPYLVDRYDPEPWWALAAVFAWGALFATGVSAMVNSINTELLGAAFATIVSAPLVEELTKGLAILGMVVFLRREFDGVVDGMIYGLFVALGFAATENIIYYARFSREIEEVFVLRGLLTPWIHPLFTVMTGIGFGLGREHGARWAKVLFPAVGYLIGVALHTCWNGLPQLFPDAFALNLAVGTIMAVAFFLMICAMVYRKGQVIKKYLTDEVLVGTLSQEEFDLITGYGGRLQARLSWRGKPGGEFVAAGARLALSKWHVSRALKGQMGTISADFIGPLRQELARLRVKMQAQQKR